MRELRQLTSTLVKSKSPTATKYPGESFLSTHLWPALRLLIQSFSHECCTILDEPLTVVIHSLVFFICGDAALISVTCLQARFHHDTPWRLAH